VRRIAEGRASEIFELGHGLVLRRFKSGGDAEREALVMRHAAAHGYPVPDVLEVESDALVLERIEGRTMADTLRRRPGLFRRHGLLLAQLHERLHEVAAPPELPGAGAGDRLLHLDLHPENVILSPTGPVVVDWTNARRGDPALDVALTWVILATSAGLPGRLFLRRFLPHFDQEELRRALPLAAERRLADATLSDDERRAVRRLVEGP
jgi:aminoglycoside phosphotransferase (APT) family kinase protein